jgi:hypothetical protein
MSTNFRNVRKPRSVPTKPRSLRISLVGLCVGIIGALLVARALSVMLVGVNATDATGVRARVHLSSDCRDCGKYCACLARIFNSAGPGSRQNVEC